MALNPSLPSNSLVRRTLRSLTLVTGFCGLSLACSSANNPGSTGAGSGGGGGAATGGSSANATGGATAGGTTPVGSTAGNTSAGGQTSTGGTSAVGATGGSGTTGGSSASGTTSATGGNPATGGTSAVETLQPLAVRQRAECHPVLPVEPQPAAQQRAGPARVALHRARWRPSRWFRAGIMRSTSLIVRIRTSSRSALTRILGRVL